MRIAYISDLAPPKKIGGAETVMMREAVEMARRGNEVHIISLGPYPENYTNQSEKKSKGEISHHYIGRGVFDPYSDVSNVSITNRVATILLGIYNPLFSKRLKSIISEVKPEIIHSHYIYGISYGAVSSGVGDDIPWVHTFHDYLFECPRTSLTHRSGKSCSSIPWYCEIRNRMFKQSFGQPDYIITISKFIEGRLINASFPKSRLVYLANPVDIPETNLKLTYESFLLFVGRLEICKGISDFATKFLKSPIGENSLIIAGTGPEETKLKKIAYASKTKIRVLGKVTDHQLQELYSSCRAVVFPSMWPEVLPQVPLEAMSYSKPVIAMAIGGTVDFITDGVNGFLCSLENMNSFVERAIQLLEDENLAKKMGINGRMIVEDLSVNKHVDRLIEIYLRVIAGNNHSSRVSDNSL